MPTSAITLVPSPAVCSSRTAAARIRNRTKIALTRLQLAEPLPEHYPDEGTEAQEHLDITLASLTEPVELAVWAAVTEVLESPGVLVAEFERRRLERLGRDIDAEKSKRQTVGRP